MHASMQGILASEHVPVQGRLACEQVFSTQGMQFSRRAHVPMCLACLHAHVLMCLRCSCTTVPYVLMCQCALSACLPHASTCLACLCYHLSTCLASSRAFISTCLESFASHGMRDHVITCKHALPA